MALLFVDSFDHYVTADITEKWGTNTSSSGSIQAAAGRHSSAALRVGVIGAVISRTFVPGSTTVIIGAAVKLGALVATQSIFEVRSGSTVQASVGVNASGYITIYRSDPNTGTLLYTAITGAITAGNFVFIEAKITIDPAAGAAVVNVEGLEVVNQSSLNTAQSGVAVWDKIALDSNNSNNDFDDLYVLDSSGSAPWNDLLGDVRVDVRYPTAEGANSAWTPLSGSDNALMVDETAPDDDTTYNSTTSVANVDTHVVNDAPVPGAILYGVQVNFSMKKSDTGACTLAPVIRHSSTDHVGTAVSPGTSYSYGVQAYQTNPGTSAAWDETDFNNAEFGYKRIS